MKNKFFKVKVSYTDKNKKQRYFYEYFLAFENGNVQRVKSNYFTDKEGRVHDNRDVLNALATEVKSFDEVNYYEYGE